MVLRKLSIILSSLLFIRCNDSSPADYYSYLQIIKGQPKVIPVDDSKLHVNFQIAENFKITDTSKTENLKFQISFNGLIQVFPEDFHFNCMQTTKRFHYRIQSTIPLQLPLIIHWGILNQRKLLWKFLRYWIQSKRKTPYRIAFPIFLFQALFRIFH